MANSTIEHEIWIDASPERVWHQMLDQDKYPRWAEAGWPDSGYEGKFAIGEEVRFCGPEGDGLLARTVELKKYALLDMRFEAILKKGGEADRDSAQARMWQTGTESYQFLPQDHGTLLKVMVTLPDEWASMMNETWPPALQALKQLAEND